MNKMIAFGATSAVSLAAGLVGGYHIAKKKFAQDYVEQLQEELADAKDFIAQVEKDLEDTRRQFKAGKRLRNPYSTPEEAARYLLPEGLDVQKDGEETDEAESNGQAFRQAVAQSPRVYPQRQPGKALVEDPPPYIQQDGKTYKKKEFDLSPRERLELHAMAQEAIANYRGQDPSDNTVVHNIFNEDDDMPEQISNDDTEIYLITVEDFLQNEREWAQSNLNYYTGDDVLADDRDDVVENRDDIIGVGNLRFGEGSKDQNIVYIRNERLQLDIEVVKNRGKFVEEALGLGDGPHKVRSHRA